MSPLQESTLAAMGKPKSVDSEPANYYMPTGDYKLQPNSPFLRLPGKIRNQIYAYAFDSATLRNKSLARKYPGMFYVPSDWKACPDATAVLLTCRQVYLEAICFRSDFHTIELHPALLTPRLGGVIGKMGRLQIRVFKMDTGMMNFFADQVIIHKKQEWSYKSNLKVVFPNLEQIMAIDRVGKYSPMVLRRAIEKGFGLNPGCTKPQIVLYGPFFGLESAKFPKIEIMSG
jgi:hypothetical protein